MVGAGWQGGQSSLCWWHIWLSSLCCVDDISGEAGSVRQSDGSVWLASPEQLAQGCPVSPPVPLSDRSKWRPSEAAAPSGRVSNSSPCSPTWTVEGCWLKAKIEYSFNWKIGSFLFQEGFSSARGIWNGGTAVWFGNLANVPALLLTTTYVHVHERHVTFLKRTIFY